MANGKIPNFNNKFYGDKLVEVTFPDSTGSLGFDEYNAVLNNANSSITSSKIMNADYALNARIPTNNDRLISGTAQRMEIQDSNYSSVAWTSPRYVGSKTISATYNDYTPSGSSVTFADGTVGTWKGDQVFDEYPDDETFTRGNPLGKVPAIDLYSTHFVLFDRINIDEAFADGDIFHCLYLIDDQGNKQPLTYRNKNLVDLQRIFVKGSNAEVLFLGQNNQEVLDEYPILEVGKIFSERASFTNDVFKLDSTSLLYEPYWINNELAVSNAYIRHTFINDRQTDYTVRFVPSAFNIESLGGDDYRLTYSNTDIRNGLLSSLQSSLSMIKSYIRRTKQIGYQIFNYGFFDGSSSLNMDPQNHDSKFDPFYFLTWNPKTSKIFEGTLLEQKVDWNLHTPNPYTQTPNDFLTPVGYPTTNATSIGSISNYENTWSPLKQGDIITFGNIPTTLQVDEQNIGNIPFQSEESIINNFREYYSPSSNIEAEVIDINYPLSQSYNMTLYPGSQLNGANTFYNEQGNSISNTTPIYQYAWTCFPSASPTPPSQEQTRGIRGDITPTQGTLNEPIPYYFLSSSPVQNFEGFFTLCADEDDYVEDFSGDYELSTSQGIHTLIINKLDRSGADRSSFLLSLSHGDIIEFGKINNYNFSTNYTDNVSYRYKILQKPFYANLVGGVQSNLFLVIRIQYIPTDNDLPYISNTKTNQILKTVVCIKKICKYRAPYIDIKISQTTSTDISGSINTSGSVLSVVGVNTHEQYITSQFLEGSGVGALIPDNYDPKLREQLPDIINKTGIDINSLT
jgi:hypothetical protein